MNHTKIRIKVGEVEVDYEGDSAFLKSDLLKLIQELQKSEGSAPARSTPDRKLTTPAPQSGQMTTKTIATKLDAKTASDLAKAAMYHLVVMQGKTQATGNEILKEMKNATGHYKASMSGNHTKTLRILLNKNILVENAKDVYSLVPAVEQQLKIALSGG